MAAEPKRSLASYPSEQPPTKRVRTDRRRDLPSAREAGSSVAVRRGPAGEGREITGLAREHGQGRARPVSSLDAPTLDGSPSVMTSKGSKGSRLESSNATQFSEGTSLQSTVPVSASSPRATALSALSLLSSSVEEASGSLSGFKKYKDSVDSVLTKLRDSLARRHVPDDVVTELIAEWVRSVMGSTASLPSKTEGAPSPGGPDHRQRLGLPPDAEATLRATQMFEASSQVAPTSATRARGRPRISPPQSEPSDDEAVVVDMGRRKAGRPGIGMAKTLVEALYARRERSGTLSGEGGDVLDVISVARRVQDRDFDNVVSSRDLCLIGGAVLGDVFAGRGQKRLAEAFIYLYGHRSKERLDRTLKASADTLARQIREAGSDMLSEFTTRWARAVQQDTPMSAAEDIQLMHMKVSLVKQWEHWSRASDHRSDKELGRFLTQRGVPNQKHLTLSARVAKYLSQELDFAPKELSKKIYNWTPLAIMADTFGEGVFALIPKNLSTSYQGLRITDGFTKEEKFRKIVAAIDEELPEVAAICHDCDRYIVQPLLSQGLEDGVGPVVDTRVPGIRMAVEGDLQRLRQTPISELMSTLGLPPIGTIEDLETSDLEDLASSRK